MIPRLERKYQKKLNSLQRQTRKSDLPLTFDNTSVTAYGNFGNLEAFKKAIDFQSMLKRISLKRHHNCKYSDTELLDTLIDALSLGLLRFSHMNALQTDPGFKKIKEVTQVPDESTMRNFVSLLCEQGAVDQIPLVNQQLLSLKAKSEQPREVWLDIDDSVLTVFGKQEGSKVGYNPRYHGRPSYKVKVAFISETCELVNARLYSGNIASNGQFMEFLKEISTEQLTLDLKTFDYQVIITSSDEYSPEEVWHEYNKR